MRLYKNRVLYYLFYLELIENELKTIEEMAECAAQSNFSADENDGKEDDGNEKNLKSISEYYQLTRELCEELNAVFAWSNAASVSFLFSLILTEVNWVYWKWYNHFDIMYMIGELSTL